jgi:hypothetical protein
VSYVERREINHKEISCQLFLCDFHQDWDVLRNWIYHYPAKGFTWELTCFRASNPLTLCNLKLLTGSTSKLTDHELRSHKRTNQTILLYILIFSRQSDNPFMNWHTPFKSRPPAKYYMRFGLYKPIVPPNTSIRLTLQEIRILLPENYRPGSVTIRNTARTY